METRQITNTSQLFDWVTNVCNSGTAICRNARLIFELPSGIEIFGPKESENSTQIIVPKGYYSSSQNIWHIGDIEANTCYSPNFSFIVSNLEEFIAQDQDYIRVVVKSSCINEDTTDNVSILKLDHTSQESECKNSITIG